MLELRRSAGHRKFLSLSATSPPDAWWDTGVAARFAGKAAQEGRLEPGKRHGTLRSLFAFACVYGVFVHTCSKLRLLVSAIPLL